MKPRIEGKLSAHLAEALFVILFSALLPSTPALGAETAYIYGLEGWYGSGDTIQFVGDSKALEVVYPPGCDEWYEGCVVDRGFSFREVSGVNTTTCAIADSSDTCYVFAVVCCYWMGDCLTHPCNTEEVECWQSEEECGENCYCMSIWEVKGFNVAPGDEEPPDGGCYEIEMICDTSVTECRQIGKRCATSIPWWD